MRHAAYLFALSLCAHPLAACDGDDQPAAETKAAAVVDKKIFTTPRTSAHKNLDPVKQFDVASSELIANLYDTLLSYHYLKRPYELAPNLLARMPELSADGLTYTFELREGVRFADDPCFPGGKGRVLNTDDVIYSIKRFADANQNVESYLLWQGAVKGMDAFREQTAKLGKQTDYGKLEIAGVKKLDDRRFTLELEHKNPLALYPLAAPQLSIVPREAVEHYADGFGSHPVGTGPFRIKQLARRGVIVLEKNPSYHLTYPSEGAPGDAERGLLRTAGKQLPLVDEVHLPLIEEPQPWMLKFLRGDLDWVPIDHANFVKLAYKDAKGFHLRPEYAGKYAIYHEPSLTTSYFELNLKDALLGNNRALRQAIAHAIDAASYVEQMRNGRGRVAKTLLPWVLPGSERDIDFTPIEYDLEKAKAKLAEAGYPGGKGLPPIVVEYRDSGPISRQTHEFYRAQLARAGIVIEPSFQTFSAFLKKVETGNFQMTENAWKADFPDASTMFQILHSEARPPGPNHAAYDNPEYDRLYEQSRFMDNGPERYALFKRMSELIKRDVPIIPTWSWIIVGLHQKWVGNFKRNMMMDKPYAYLDIDAAAKAKGLP